MTTTKLMNLMQHVKSRTPKFFQVLRTTGMALAAIGGALLATSIALPAVVLTIAGYVTVAGTVMSAVSQLAVNENTSEHQDNKTIVDDAMTE